MRNYTTNANLPLLTVFRLIVIGMIGVALVLTQNNLLETNSNQVAGSNTSAAAENLPQILIDNNFNYMHDLLAATNMWEVLSINSEYLIVSPTDKAFLSSGIVPDLISVQSNPDRWEEIARSYIFYAPSDEQLAIESDISLISLNGDYVDISLGEAVYTGYQIQLYSTDVLN